MTDREYEKRKEKLDDLFDDFMKCILKTYEDDPKYIFTAFMSYSSTFLTASVPVDKKASIMKNLRVLKDHCDQVFLNSTNNMINGLKDPDYLDNEFTVHLDDED